ncbi:MAG: hypothetical protein ACTSRG_00125 [Candidatus Helarchaeota archaeon]
MIPKNKEIFLPYWSRDAAQISSFMFHVDKIGHEEYVDDTVRKLSDNLNQNMDWTYPIYFWSDIEPTKGNYNWTELDNFVNSDIKYKLLNMGPEFTQNSVGNYSIRGEIPNWIDNNISGPKSNYQLKTEYQALLNHTISRYKNNITMWWIGFEVNMGGDVNCWNWTMWKDWLNWQVGFMKNIDPNAKIMISFGSWLDYHEPIPPTGIDEINGTQELITMGIDFDVVGIEYHYGTLQNGSLIELDDAIRQLEQITNDKEIFLWEVYYPGLNKSYNSNWS